jgi:hypothetical protein
MKKFIVISLCGLLIMAFSSIVCAQEKLEFKASGFIDTVTEYWRNVSGANSGATIYDGVKAEIRPGGSAFNKEAAYVETRSRLKFDMAYGKEVSGTIYLEMDGTWGNADGTRNSYAYWSADRAALEIKNVYIDWAPAFIPIPTTMRVGVQGFGIRPNLLVLTDGPGITLAFKVDPVTISPFWFKAAEGTNWVSDDTDVYGLQASAKVNTFTVGGYFMYYNMRGYPFPSGTPGTTYSAGIWWAGLYGDGKLGPLNLNLDFIYDNGKVKDNTDTFDDVKYSGYVGRLKLAFPWEKFEFGGQFLYASGADKEKTNANGLPGTNSVTGGSNSKVKSWVGPPGSEAAPVYGESIVFYSCWINRGNTGIGSTWNYGQLHNGGIGGTWNAKLYGSVMPVEGVKITLQGLYIGDTTKHGDTVGTAREADGVTFKDENTIGWEGDIISEFQLTKQLKYTIGAGMLAPGKALSFWDGASNAKPKAPWSITSMFVYNF